MEATDGVVKTILIMVIWWMVEERSYTFLFSTSFFNY